MKKILNGPSGVKIVLDSNQIFPDDPGQGTPALVVKGEFTSTYNCASSEGELDCGAYRLTDAELDWLQSEEIYNQVDDFLTQHGG